MSAGLNTLFRYLSGDLGPEEEKKRDFYKSAIPTAASAAEAYFNPSSVLRTLSQPAKRELVAALSKSMRGRGVSTSAINMAYGKRRNYRSKRRSYRRASSSKRSNGRRKRVTKRTSGSSTLAVIKKALGGSMSY